MKSSAKKLNLSLEGELNKVIEKSKIRLLFLVSAVCITFIIIAAKTVKLTFFLDSEIKESKVITAKKNLKEFKRPKIYDREGNLISTSLKTSSLFANPKIMIEKEKAANELSKIFPSLKKSDLLEKFNSDKSFIWIKRNLHPQQKYRANAIGVPGLIFKDEEKRIYPHGGLFSHLIGTVGIDGNGLAGLERGLDKKIKESNNGIDDITTSLDIRVQTIVREEVLKQVKKHKAKKGIGIVLNVTNGEVISAVNYPDFDSNLPGKAKNKNMFNSITLGNYELGSIFKPISFAMGLEENKVKMWSVIDASEPLEVSRFTITDFHPKERKLSLPEILMYSSNIGTAKIAKRVGNSKMKEYFEKLKFYEKLDIEVPEKSKPIMPRVWRDVNTLTASYGHGIASSPMHAVAAIATTINGGLYFQPTIIKQAKPPVGKRIFSKKTSDNMRKLMRLVVSEKGASGGKGEAKGYFVGGKTGTAEKLSDGKYDKKKLTSSFVGVFPMTKPEYIVLVTLDEPKGTKDTWNFATGGWVSAPAVSKIISRIAPILKVEPVNENDPKIKKEFKVKYKI